MSLKPLSELSKDASITNTFTFGSSYIYNRKMKQIANIDQRCLQNSCSNHSQILNNIQSGIVSTQICNRDNDNESYSYLPSFNCKDQRFIEISKDFTQRCVPLTVRENIANAYIFIIKSTAMIYHSKNAVCLDTNSGSSSMILNYDFHDKKTGAILYCIADRIWNRHNHYKYLMRNQLYTKQDIIQLSAQFVHVPKSSRYSCDEMLTKIKVVQHKLASSISSVLCRTKWNQIRVYNAAFVGTKKDKTLYNKRRMTLFLTKPEFASIIKRSVYQLQDTRIQLIPIIMFNQASCEYRIEYVQILKLYDNIDIGISYFHDSCKNIVRVTGIHLSKHCILNQHKLVSHNHKCRCLDAFHSIIDDVRIGNPDEDLNRLKDLRSRTKHKIKELNDEVCDLKDKKRLLEIQVKHLRAQLRKTSTQQPVIKNTAMKPIIGPNQIRVPFQQYVYQNNCSMPSLFSASPIITPQSLLTPNISISMSLNGIMNVACFPNTIWPISTVQIPLSQTRASNSL